MTSLRDNKSFQVIIGAFVVYAAYRLWRSGVLLGFMAGEPEGYGNTQLLLTVGVIVVDFLQLVGIAAIGIVSGILPELQSIVTWLQNWIRNVIDKYKAGSDNSTADFDWRPIIFIVIAYMLFSSGKLTVVYDLVRNLITPSIEPVSTYKSAIFWIDDDATSEQKLLANSYAVEELFNEVNVERRLYYADQDVSGAEQWASSMVETLGGDGSSIMLLDVDGYATERPLPTTIEQIERLLDGT